MTVDLPREIALKALYDINEKGGYSNITLNRYLEAQELKKIEKSFITELVYGSLQWKLTIDWIIQKYSNIKIKKISPWILNVLRIGVYQILYLNKVPSSAACNESVSLAKKYGHMASSKYVNAVLRNIIRDKENIGYPEREKDVENYLSVKYSHPVWMVKEWLGRFGLEFTEELLAANNRLPDFSVRINSLKTSKEELIQNFEDQGIQWEKGKYLEEAFLLKNPSDIAKMEGFQKGHFHIQDESSMLVARVLDPQPSELVLDVCSAPGGKTTHMGQLMKNQGTIIARDIHPHKISIIRGTAARLGIQIIQAECHDATETDKNYIQKADKVLVDAPCTGLGIINRKPDIKWSRTIGDKKSILALQKQILHTSAQYVKPGGALVYSTCTIEWEENEGMVQKFADEHPEFQLVDISSKLPQNLIKATAKEGFIQLYPNVDGIDGFFIAKMVRKER